MSNLSDKPAFPVPYDATGFTAVGGLTLREYYVGMALQGLMDSGDLARETDIARWAVGYADALIAELEKGKTNE
jgi:hypothetical protein